MGYTSNMVPCTTYNILFKGHKVDRPLAPVAYRSHTQKDYYYFFKFIIAKYLYEPKLLGNWVSFFCCHCQVNHLPCGVRLLVGSHNTRESE